MKKFENSGRVFVRIKSRRRKTPRFKEKTAIKIPGPNGTMLLRPQPVAEPIAPTAPVTIALTEGVTVQLAKEPTHSPQAPRIRATGSSAQGSHPFIGLGKHAAAGKRFDRHLGY